MLLFSVSLALIIGLSFWTGMLTGSARKEQEYEDIIDNIFRRKYIMHEKTSTSEVQREGGDYEFMVMKNGKSIKPVFSKFFNNN